MRTETSVKELLIIVAALVCGNSIISCSGDGAKTQSSVETQMKPSEVVTAAYMAANEEKYAEVKNIYQQKQRPQYKKRKNLPVA
jgi:hypothetical protein